MKNIPEAFTFIFKDPNWIAKIAIGAFFVFLSIFLIGIPVIYGYSITLLQRVQRGEQKPLPEWKDVGILFILGLKYLVILFIFYLPVTIISLPMIILMFILLTQGLAPLAFIEGSMIVMSLISIIVLYSLFISLLTPIIAVKFAERERIGDGLQISKILRSFKFIWQDVLIIVALCYACDILASLGLIVLIFGVFFTSFYVTLVRLHLYGQISRDIQELSVMPI